MSSSSDKIEFSRFETGVKNLKSNTEDFRSARTHTEKRHAVLAWLSNINALFVYNGHADIAEPGLALQNSLESVLSGQKPPLFAPESRAPDAPKRSGLRRSQQTKSLKILAALNAVVSTGVSVGHAVNRVAGAIEVRPSVIWNLRKRVSLELAKPVNDRRRYLYIVGPSSVRSSLPDSFLPGSKFETHLEVETFFASQNIEGSNYEMVLKSLARDCRILEHT